MTLTSLLGPLTSLWLVRVMTLLVCPGKLRVAGLKDTWSSAGTPEALRVTVPVNPDWVLTVTGTLSVEQGGTLSVAGELTENRGWTPTSTLAERAVGPTEALAGVPVMVKYG